MLKKISLIIFLKIFKRWHWSLILILFYSISEEISLTFKRWHWELIITLSFSLSYYSLSLFIFVFHYVYLQHSRDGANFIIFISSFFPLFFLYKFICSEDSADFLLNFIVSLSNLFIINLNIRIHIYKFLYFCNFFLSFVLNFILIEKSEFFKF